MCGRYYFSSPEEFFKQYSIPKKEYRDLKPNYNVAPGTEQPIILRDYKGNHLRVVKWGLIPTWAKDSKIGYKLINARLETLLEKPSWRKPFISQRALIPANGFYEWKKSDGSKFPYVIKAKDRDVISFAGLWDTWKDPNGNLIPTFTIVTAPADKTVSKIHDRMPVILTKEGENLWLDPETKNPDLLEDILRNKEEHSLVSYPVSQQVNKVANNSPELIKKV